MKFHSSLFTFLLLALLSGCVLNPKFAARGGDSEPIHGGDVADLKLRSIRSRMVVALYNLKSGVTVPVTSSPANCTGYPAPQLCDALGLSVAQQSTVRDFLIRNLDDLIAAHAGENPVPIVVTNEQGTFQTPSGQTRSVLAWIVNDASGNRYIKVNSAIRDTADATVAALLVHESLHLITDMTLGHELTDNEVIGGFPSVDGSGRLFADTVGAAVALTTYPVGAASSTAQEITLDTPILSGHFPTGNNVPVDGQLLFADVNADHRSDAVYITLNNNVYVALGQDRGVGPVTLWASHSGTFKRGQFQLADVTGDQADDLLFQNDDGVIERYTAGPTGFGNATMVGNIASPFIAGQVQYFDLNNDSRKDLIFQNDDNQFQVGLQLPGAGFDTLALWGAHGPSFYQYTALFGDWNGDGRNDLLFQSANANNFWLSLNGSGSFGAPALVTSFAGDWTLGRSLLGDVNGDNRTDLVYVDVNNVVWFALSSGTAVLTAVPVGLIDGVFVPGRLKLSDVNGDGKADLLYQRENSSFEVAYSLGAKITDWKKLAQASYAVNANAFSYYQPGNIQINRKQLMYVDQHGDIFVAPLK